LRCRRRKGIRFDLGRDEIPLRLATLVAEESVEWQLGAAGAEVRHFRETSYLQCNSAGA
jgi:hypothetical protein